MALFTDGAISSLEDLRAYESTIYDLASTERIDLSRKLVLAHQDGAKSEFFRLAGVPDSLTGYLDLCLPQPPGAVADRVPGHQPGALCDSGGTSDGS